MCEPFHAMNLLLDYLTVYTIHYGCDCDCDCDCVEWTRIQVLNDLLDWL